MIVFSPVRFAGTALETLAHEHEVFVDEGGFASPTFMRVAPTVAAILATVGHRVDAALLATTPRLSIVSNVAVGTDNVDLPACRARGVHVTNTPDILSEATATLAFALLLAAARRVAEGDRFVRAGKFDGFDSNLLLGVPVFGQTLGIVGLGRIGQAMARRARGFGMRVFYAQRTRLSEPLERALGATFVSIDELFAASDFVSLHCPLTAETRGLASAERIASMKRGSVFVNTSRGACVDEAALARALQRGLLAAAGLDVYEGEPTVHPELLRSERVVLLPHIGSAETETRARMTDLAVENVRAVLAGKAPITPV